MVRVYRPSGQELAVKHPQVFQDAASLKQHLREVYGYPVYLQQLLRDGRVLADDAELDTSVHLQLVLLFHILLPLTCKLLLDGMMLTWSAACWMLVLTKIS